MDAIDTTSIEEYDLDNFHSQEAVPTVYEKQELKAQDIWAAQEWETDQDEMVEAERITISLTKTQIAIIVAALFFLFRK